MAHKFDPSRADRLLSPDRLRILPPDELLDHLTPRAGEVAADIGCGPGFLTLPLAHRLTPKGWVWACDIAPEMLTRLQERLGAAECHNVTPVLSAESRVPLPDASCDLLLLVHMLHELEAPESFFAEMARLLRPGGRGLAVDWSPEPSPSGPPLAVRVPPERASTWITAGSLTVDTIVPAGPHAYAIRFHRS